MSKLTEGEQTLTYAKVADLLRAAYRAKAKTSDDGFESWLDSNDYDEYEKVMGE